MGIQSARPERDWREAGLKDFLARKILLVANELYDGEKIYVTKSSIHNLY
jgi:hypothetical protein